MAPWFVYMRCCGEFQRRMLKIGLTLKKGARLEIPKRRQLNRRKKALCENSPIKFASCYSLGVCWGVCVAVWGASSCRRQWVDPGWLYCSAHFLYGPPFSDIFWTDPPSLHPDYTLWESSTDWTGSQLVDIQLWKGCSSGSGGKTRLLSNTPSSILFGSYKYKELSEKYKIVSCLT
jgi:hypothetical protein